MDFAGTVAWFDPWSEITKGGLAGRLSYDR
jgi:hypothetical protein